MAKYVERARVKPGRLPIAKGVVKIEATFHAFEKRKSLEITDRHPVLENQSPVISAQRQAPLSRQTHHKNINATSNIRFENSFRVAVRKSIKLAIAYRQGLACHVKNRLALLLRKELQTW